MPFSVTAEDLFSDGLESGDFSSTNAGGFAWTDGSWTTVVSDDTELAGSSSSPQPKATAASFAGGDWTPYSGNNSIRFRYAAGAFMSEQRFNLGTAEKDIWISYWLRVPTNFQHGTSSPTNHKLFALWMDDYSNKGAGPTVAWEFWGDGSGGSDLAFHYGSGGTGLGSHLQLTPFISYPSDQGRWMHVVFHVNDSTSSGSNDGVIQMWRKWDGEGTYTKFHEKLDNDIAAPAGGPNGWEAGYLMGWANAAYSNNTEWLVDNFELANSDIWNVE